MRKEKMRVSKFYKIFMNNTVLYRVFYSIKQEEFKTYFYSYELIRKLIDTESKDPLLISKLLEDYERDKGDFNIRDRNLIKDIIEEIKSISDKQTKEIFEFKEHFDTPFMKAQILNFNYEKFLEFEQRNFFLYYLTELENYFFRCFKYILLKRPILLSNMKIDFQELLERKSNLVGESEESSDDASYQMNIIDSFIEEKVEKKIHDLFYQDYTEILKFADKKLSLKHEISLEKLKTLNLLKQIRNAYIHGDGSLNYIILNKMKKIEKSLPISQRDIGAKITLEEKILEFSQDFIINLALKFDSALLIAYPETAVDFEISL